MKQAHTETSNKHFTARTYNPSLILSSNPQNPVRMIGKLFEPGSIPFKLPINLPLPPWSFGRSIFRDSGGLEDSRVSDKSPNDMASSTALKGFGHSFEGCLFALSDYLVARLGGVDRPDAW